MLRRQIRESITEALKAKLQIPVYSGKFQPVDESAAPFVRVFAQAEECEIYLDDSFRRTLNLEVLIYASGEENLDDTLDDVSEKVEQCLLSNPLRGQVQSIDLKTMRMDTTTHANREFGVIELIFEVVYDWLLDLNPTPIESIDGVFESPDHKTMMEFQVSIGDENGQ